MEINKAILLIEDLIKSTDNKKEEKVYNTFSNILKSLETLNLTKEKLELIGKKIEELDLGSTQDKKLKYLKLKLNEFKVFLKNEISLVEEQHYAGLGMTLGMVFGIVTSISLGLEFGMGDKVTGGLIVGMIAGMVVGAVIDMKAKKENRVFKM